MGRWLVGLILFFSLAGRAQSIIPEPVSVQQTGGLYHLSGGQLFYTVRPAAATDPPEGYTLDITPKGVVLTAAGAGLFYAEQTLKQLMPPGSSAVSISPTSTSGIIRVPGAAPHPAAMTIPCVHIVDYPRYGFRGMHLDVSRHFFSVAFIKKYLDILAAYKLNVFHWHLTDSHGWRIEIKKYPRLTSVGAWRADRTGIPTTIAKPTAIGEAATYGGYYTQDEIRAVVAYAAKRFITIIPEIEIPGHCDAALVAYPEFSDLDNPVPLLRPCGYPGDLTHNLCVGYEPSFSFVEDILSEVMVLFPGPFIHIGGDEVRGGPWLGCSRCRQRMQEKGLTTAKQYQAWFTHRIDSFISAHGKRTIGWDDILGADITTSAAAMAWHNQEAAVQALKKGHDMVMAPYHYTYFDFYQSDPRLEPDITYASLPLDTVYAFEPTPSGLTPEENKHVLGGAACLWTENFATPAQVEYMLLPRLLALAEVLWTPADKKDYGRFVRKTEAQFNHFKATGLAYATSLYNVAIQPGYDSVEHGIRVALADQTHLYPIRYALNGTEPTMHSAVYSKPILVKRTADLRTRVFKDNRPVGKTNGDRLTIHLATGAATTEPRLVDGIHGTIEPYDGRWVIFHDSVVSIVIDLATVKRVHSFTIGCLEDQVGDMYLPRSIEVAASADGERYDRLYTHTNPKLPTQLIRHTVDYHKEGLALSARYIKCTFVRPAVSPDPLKNQFVLDEITLR